MMTIVTMSSIPLSGVITFPALGTFLGWFLAVAMILGVGALASMAWAARASEKGSKKGASPVRFRVVTGEFAHHKVA